MRRSGECGIACRTQGQQKFIFQLIFSILTLLSQSATAAVISPPTASFFQFSTFYTFVYFSIVHFPAVLIPSLESTVFSESLVDRLREYDSAAETTAHLLSFSYPPLISLSPFSCCSAASISVLTEAHFRWSVLLRHVPFSSVRTSFFTYPTRPSHPQIYCQCGG